MIQRETFTSEHVSRIKGNTRVDPLDKSEVGEVFDIERTAVNSNL